MTPLRRAITAPPTMQSVALAAGVSLKTVSRVVNDEPGVVPDTAQRVMVAIMALGYRRNDAASSLARGQSQAGIGLVIEDITDPFYARLTRGVEEVARAHGHLVILASSEENTERERSTTLTLASRGVAGMIVVPHSTDHRYLARQISAGLAVVFVDRPPARLTADSVLTDNVSGARIGTQHLIARGHRRIGFIGNDRGVYTSERRLQGFREALTLAGLEAEERMIVLGPRTQAEASEAVSCLLSGSDAPTALFTQNDLMTMGAWRAIRQSGRHVALVGFDDFALADVLDPPVTVVAQDATHLGRSAAELLFSRLDGFTGPSESIIIPTRLIVRDQPANPAR